MSSSSVYPGPDELVQPALYGGQSKLRDPLFTEATFQSRCPPTVKRSSIIVAVCGPTDFKDSAAPNVDGWFFSDFYLMHHLFRGTASEQYWLTCVSPETYVQKYTEALHGDPSGDRRIVLDKSMLEDTKDIRTFRDKDLASHFLSYVSQASKSTRGTNRQILIMMFGHGWENVYSVFIGGTEDPQERPENAISPRILQTALKRNNPQPRVTVLTTSCFGGGWSFAAAGNTSNIHGATAARTLQSWPISASVGRSGGSLFATAIAQALIRTEIVGKSEESPYSTDTYATLTKTINDILVNEVGKGSILAGTPSFAAQDDLWGADSRARSGFPLSSFKERCNALRIAPQGQRDDTSAGLSGCISTKPDYPFQSMIAVTDALGDANWIELGVLKLPIEAAYPRIKSLAKLYMSIQFPGDHESAKNVALHGRCKRIVGGRPISSSDLQFIAKALQYRMVSIISQANRYKAALGGPLAEFPWCHEVSEQVIVDQVCKGPVSGARFQEISMMFLERAETLFDSPGRDCGHVYIRGKRWLAVALESTGWSMETISDALDQLAALKAKTDGVRETVKRFKLSKRPAIRMQLEQIARSCKRKLRDDDNSPGRDASPSKVARLEGQSSPTDSRQSSPVKGSSHEGSRSHVKRLSMDHYSFTPQRQNLEVSSSHLKRRSLDVQGTPNRLTRADLPGSSRARRGTLDDLFPGLNAKK